MFIDASIPNEFNKVAEISDNYIVLVKVNVLNSGTNYEAYYQFFNPSTEVIHTNNYKITQGDNYQYNYYYTNNDYFSYIDYTKLEFSKNTFELTNTSSDLWERHDYWSIGLTVALLLSLTILITNLATSLVHRGGIFHG